MSNTIFTDLGRIEYGKSVELQEKLFDKVYNNKKLRADNESLTVLNFLLFCEHPHVYTMGKSGNEQNLLINSIQMQAEGAEFYTASRGGDITYHGPGQIVGYPILDLEYFGLGVKSYISKIEDVVIKVLANYGIRGERLHGATGVWLDPEDKLKARKICAIGIKTSRYVSMHGFAFNINTALEYFDYINPCGFTDKSVTSLQKELGEQQDIEKVKKLLIDAFSEVFKMSVTLCKREEL